MSTVMTNPAKQKALTSFIVFVIIAALVVGAKVTAGGKSTPMTSTQPATSQTPAASTGAKTGNYKDGTYSADGAYQSPGGQQIVSVSLTLNGGKVTNSTVVGKADGGVAQFYQNSFVGSYKKSVIGKAIDSIHVSRVAGSSLTSNGFNNALKKIKQQAT